MANLTDRAAFYLCLARVYLPPRESMAYDAIKRHLADDLSDLAAGLGYPAADIPRELRNAVAGIPDHLTLLQTYSSLFMAPPAPVALNAGFYLDGAVMGRATAAIEKCYLQAGLTRSESFHDLPDHIALQLEFAAYLCASEAAGSAPAIKADDFLATAVRGSAGAGGRAGSACRHLSVPGSSFAGRRRSRPARLSSRARQNEY